VPPDRAAREPESGPNRASSEVVRSQPCGNRRVSWPFEMVVAEAGAVPSKSAAAITPAATAHTAAIDNATLRRWISRRIVRAYAPAPAFPLGARGDVAAAWGVPRRFRTGGLRVGRAGAGRRALPVEPEARLCARA